ncbi:MAG: ATP-binding protein [Arenicella sp.]|nr:ATP-binding protein [Arenicella sp.]
MGFRELVKKASGPLPVITVCTALLFALAFLTIQSLGDDNAGRTQLYVMIVGSVGIAVLILFLITNGYALYRQYARNEIGSKLTVKFVAIFLCLTLIPFSLVYYFSIQFLNKGVDSWFDVRIEQAVEDSLLLSKTALEGIKEEITRDVETYASNLGKSLGGSELLKTLDEIRELEDYSEVSLYTDTGQIIAFSSADAETMLPDTPGEQVFSELRLNQTHTLLEPISESAQQFRVVAPIQSNELGRQFYGLQVIKLLPLRYATLASSVEAANQQYAEIVFARGPLKVSLILTLSLVSLASLLFSLLAAVYLSKRLAAPIANLAAGTQRIAEGEYGTILPVVSSDELGILTDSFNDMSQKIHQAQRVAAHSQAETETQKGYLEAVLTNLSSGVLAFDDEKCLQMNNSAAIDILGLDPSGIVGKSALMLAKQAPHTKNFFKVIDEGIDSGQRNWQKELTLLGEHGRQMLLIRGTLLDSSTANFPSNEDSLGLFSTATHDNYVIVFDDVTGLIQAQRDAAWGEVARRLAHEIKNPLTPIQLSAERIKQKFTGKVGPELEDTLERSTRTIVQQVESMKEMVNAFSTYAQPVRAQLSPLDANQLLSDVIELHASVLSDIDVKLKLDPQLPSIKANATALRQVINNLVINASHALEGVKGASLLIQTSVANNVAGQYIDILVADNGPGVPVEIRDSLFDPYVSSKAKGSGLGLAIVKRIVEEHSGSVAARDSKLGGCEFHIRLPVNAMQTYRGNRAQNAVQSDSTDTGQN